ncbi:PKD domain-containing protein [Methanosarcina sp.]|uniref:PKD domain-containing protein n=1 Tax=Methanosarcina sp. TaxID=2213 RepID=UPI002989740C|nr:PKD domain-containing protein [Methanosarcina sp.]MDW5549690.1 PKD domain-containing protein [Methanosarcina sp.]MDW5552909.1 PKD domain-containing protein [Methanosarcina sp.]MDW5558077.1 PKD domain-containing protein [Methanosarcina sp.]
MKFLLIFLILIFVLTSTASATVTIFPTPLGAGTPPATARITCSCGNSCIDYTAVAASSDPRIVQLKDLSKGNETYVRWDFGDGTPLEGTNITPSLKNPVHTFPKNGYYIICMTTRNSCCSQKLWVHMTIIITDGNATVPFKAPVTAFSAAPTSGEASLKVQFTDKSTPFPYTDKSTGVSTSWKWSFGDGTYSTVQYPSHTYSKAGNYTVSLTIKNAKGSDTKTIKNYIVVNDLKAPVAVFSASPTSGKAPLNVAFTDKSTGSPASWQWSFGDGSRSFVQNPVHKYTKAGKYTVSLTVKNNGGSSTVAKTGYIQVRDKLVAAFSLSPTSGKAPLNVAFTDKSTGTPSGWIWDFGDGSKSFIQSPTHKYSKAGKYTISLTVKNDKGSNTVTKTNYITVIDKPVAAFSASPTSGKAPLNVTFTDKSTGSPASWQWSFGDGSRSFVQNPVHKYTKAGKYTVSLTVKNAKGSNIKTMSECVVVS